VATHEHVRLEDPPHRVGSRRRAPRAHAAEDLEQVGGARARVREARVEEREVDAVLRGRQVRRIPSVLVRQVDNAQEDVRDRRRTSSYCTAVLTTLANAGASSVSHMGSIEPESSTSRVVSYLPSARRASSVGLSSAAGEEDEVEGPAAAEW